MLYSIVKLMRIRQWVKNTFVFFPLMFSVDSWSIVNLVVVLFAYVLLCLAASVTYIFNDILDVQNDRKHPVKKYRPIAAGNVSVRQGIFVVLILLSLITIPIIQNNIYLFIYVYLLNTTIYSVFAKYHQIWDVFFLSLGFVIRTYFGAYVLELELTNWFLLVTLSISMFLACAKRLREIQLIGTNARATLKSYSEESLQHMLLVSSSCTVIFYALAAATRGEIMILSTAVVMMGIFRFHFVMTQGEDDSPTDVLLQDKQMYLIVISWAALCVAGLAYGN